MPHTLLLADDSVTIQRVIELTFADEDIRVVAVSDGRQAVRQAQAEPPDIVLADVGMPELDGYEVAAFVKGTPALAHIPVLLLTGAFEPIDEGRAKAVGCDGVLVKPFEPQMVITRVKDLLRGDRPAQKASAPVTGGQPAASHSAAPVSADDYLDRLDAAFASREAAPESPVAPALSDAFPLRGEGDMAAALAEELAQWTPGTAAAPSQAPPAATPAAPVESAAVVAATETPAVKTEHRPVSSTESAAVFSTPPATPDAPSTLALADAFAALLAAEQGRPLEAAAARRVATSDLFLDHVTRLVVERLADRAVRDIVLDVAERLVREEIARIKAEAR